MHFWTLTKKNPRAKAAKRPKSLRFLLAGALPVCLLLAKH